MNQLVTHTFTPSQAETIAAVCQRMFPPTQNWPGAEAAGVPEYVVAAVAEGGAELHAFYVSGLDALDRESHALFGAPFTAIAAQDQDRVLEQIDAAHSADGPDAGARLEAFFGVIWEHGIQGMFCDPQYGGNRDTVGWKLVGFPGAQWGYNAEQMREGFDSRVIVIKTLKDLRDELKVTNG
ncbi:hypothetical protein ASE16_17250 [Leifsonia sp. Root227]|uniref:gluconate 2-dehydrogenase subunit 3 family protein n=1 Tax=Leifsonia sp. Root227 TaxID=1736496 RepID=UPI0006F71568|nr:gluconate 2-dehydrogenase subunit 3 family protein [Leifsonia sp. Root227]KRC47101.1 hypothetical protein ASE16_17250 [Leifsonia sp. Root227]